MSRRNLLNDLLKLHESNDAVKRGMENYTRQVEQPDMKFFKDMLLTIKGSILIDVFSKDFTDLEANEKDVMQRTYFNINQLLDFLIAPTRYIQAKKARTMSHAERQNIAKRGKAVTNGERKGSNE